MAYLFENCDFIDYILYQYDFSVSQGEKAAIQASMNHVSRSTPTIDPNCKPIGRVFYQVDGKNAMEADIYFSETCQYYIFLVEGKPVYANNLSNSGVAFFQNIFQQFEQYKKN